MATEIVIVSGDPSTEKLVLHPSDTVWVEKGQKVNWSITDDSNVGSFRIKKKKGSKQIFTLLDHPPAHQTRRGGGRVDWLAKDNEVYDYSIFWKLDPNDEKEKEKEFDPKLAVMPSLAPSDMTMLIAGVAMTALGIIAMQFWFRSQRRKKAPLKRW